MAEATDTKMTLERLRALLGSYGGVAEKWPVDERAAALALIVESDAARTEYDRAARLDALLDHMSEPDLSPALAGRITALPLPGTPLPMGWLARLIRTCTLAPRIAWQGTVAAAVVVGMVVGMATGIGLSLLVLYQPAPTGTVVAVVEPGDITVGEDGEEEVPEFAVLGLTGDDDGDDDDGAEDILDIPVT